ncbi:PepSY-associated TM helix domain-containing protein [Parabacteroides sp. OttesenSCG-928-K15]|nr:PepSY-associated TM helix domain-containing protein [Parabacteroides sp. OttesenSCG-928-K15]
MRSSNKNTFNRQLTRWARIIHRDLGYLMVGLSLVYAISGILLNHMDGQDPAYHTEAASVTLSPSLDNEQISVAWNGQEGLPALRKVQMVDAEHYRLLLEGGIGVYNKTTGAAEYEKYTRREFVYWINRLHYNKVKGWSPMADFFAGALIFFALSGLIMVKGKNSLGGRGKWYLMAGLLIPILYIIFS